MVEVYWVHTQVLMGRNVSQDCASHFCIWTLTPPSVWSLHPRLSAVAGTVVIKRLVPDYLVLGTIHKVHIPRHWDGYMLSI